MSDAQGRRLRHRLIDRVLHWLVAALVLTLLGTGFLPKLGLEFDWLLLHWACGVGVCVVILGHVASALQRGGLRHMGVGVAEAVRAAQRVGAALAGKAMAAPGGKYLLAQKLFHHAISVLLVALAATGLILLTRIDSPLWERDPYWLSADTWGLLYVLHDLAALLAIPALMLHVYFAARPEKRLFTRSMLHGWIREEEYHAHFDPGQWAPPAAHEEKSS